MKNNHSRLKGQLASISQSLATMQLQRPHLTKLKPSHVISNFYVKRQLKQTNQLLETLEINLAADLDKIKEKL